MNAEPKSNPSPKGNSVNRLGRDLQAAIDRLKAIVADSDDRRLIGDGPPNPDAALLDLCADIAQQRKTADAAYEQWRASKVGPRGPLYAEARNSDGHLTFLLQLASKLPATTAPGIYAKAIVVASSKGSRAAALGISLAEDLIGNPTLRKSLWPPENAGRV